MESDPEGVYLQGEESQIPDAQEHLQVSDAGFFLQGVVPQTS